MNESSVIAACEGASFIVHCASPVPFESMPEEQIVGPAVAGTMAVLKAAQQNKAKKVVITSSVAAVMGGQ